VLDTSVLGDVEDVNPVINPRSFVASTASRIVEAVAAMDGQMLQCVWQELDYKFDICHVTKGGYVKHL
jgi:hypothetical protein